jgi:predicted porin
MKKASLAAAIAGLMAVPTVGHAVKYKLSGQVNRAVLFVDDGVDSQVRNVDATSSGTRLQLRGSEDLGNGMQAGFFWRLQTMSNQASTQGARSQGDALTFDLRQANVFFSGGFGKLTIGQQSAASDGVMETDLSGTNALTSSDVTTYSAGTSWRSSAAGNAALGFGPAGTYNSFDGARLDAVRYDSPALGPVTVSASVGNDSVWDVAARASGGLGGGKYALAVQYQDLSGRDGAAGGAGTRDRVQYGGGASYRFSQGTSIGGHYGQRDDNVAGRDQAESWSVKLGHAWGPHALSVQYATADDVFTNAGGGIESQFVDVGYIYSIKKAQATVYAGFQHAWADADAGTGIGGIEDINVFLVGSRVSFD